LTCRAGLFRQRYGFFPRPESEDRALSIAADKVNWCLDSSQKI
jgi:hypothetical protein